MSVRLWSLSMIAATVACADGGTIGPVETEREYSPLHPRVSGPGTVTISVAGVPDQVLEVGVDDAGTFELITSEDAAQAFVEAIPGLEDVATCLGDFDDLGSLPSVCVLIEEGQTVTFDVTAASATATDTAAWSEIDRFGPACATTEDPSTLSCTLRDLVQRVSPLATFTSEDPPPPPPPPTPCDPVVGTSGEVTGMTEWQGKLIVSGNFDGFVSQYVDLVHFADDGSVVEDCLTGPGLGSVADVVQHPDGGAVVSGEFGTYNGEACANLARVDANGVVDAAFCAGLPALEPNAVVAIDGRILYIFDLFEVHAFDLDTNSVLATSPELVYEPYTEVADRAIAVDNGTVFIAADLDFVGDVAVSELAGLDAATLQTVVFAPLFDFDVEALAPVDGRLWVGGGFFQVDGNDRPNLAVFDTTTFALEPTTASLGTIHAFEPTTDGIWATGRFVLEGQDRILALLDADANVIETEPFLAEREAYGNPSGRLVVEQDGVVTVVGFFELVNGASQPRVASFARATGALLPVPNVGGPILPSVHLVDDEVLFWVPAGIELAAREFAGLYDPATQTVDPVDFGFDGTVAGVDIEGDIAYFYGTFDSNSNGAVAAYDLANQQYLWTAPFNGGVGDISISPDTIYAAGGFFSVDGFASPRCAAISKADGTPVTNFTPSADGLGYAVQFVGDAVVFGGDLNSVAGQPRGDIVWLDPNNGDVLPITAPLGGPATTIALFDGDLYVEASTSAAVSGLPEDDTLFKVDPATGTLASWQPDVVFSFIDGLDRIGDTLVVSSTVMRVGDEFGSIFAFDVATADVLDWEIPLDGRATASTILGNQVAIGTENGQILIVDVPQP